MIVIQALLHIAKVAHHARTAHTYGILGCNASQVRADMAAVSAKVKATIEQIYHEESPDKLQAKGIDVIFGHASFESANKLLIKKNSQCS